MRESQVEKRASKWARDHGWICRKNTSPGSSGVLDRIHHKQGVTAYIEYKQPGKLGNLSELQREEMRLLDGQLIPYACVDNYDDAVNFLKLVEHHFIPIMKRYQTAMALLKDDSEYTCPLSG